MCNPYAAQHLPRPCSPTLRQVQRQIYAELNQVTAVRSFFTGGGGLAGVFNDVFTSAAFGVLATASQIRDYFFPPASAFTQGPSPLGILSGALGITGGMGEFVPVAGEGIAAGAAIAAGVADIVEASTTSSTSGASLFDPYNYAGTVAGASGDLNKAFTESTDSLGHLADLLVSDQGRLAAAAQELSTPASAGGWNLTTPETNQLEGSLRQTMGQWLWLTLLPPVFATYECAPEDAEGVIAHNTAAALNTQIPYPEWRERETPTTYNLYNTFIVLGRRNHRGWPQLPSSTVTDILFGAPDYDDDSGQNVGFIPEYLFARSQATAGPGGDSDPVPASSGLLHKDAGLSQTEENSDHLALRNDWSAYTPSCGWSQNVKWSAADFASWANP